MPTGVRLLIAVVVVAMAATPLAEIAADGRLTLLLDEPWPRPAYRIAGMLAIVAAVATMLAAAYHLLAAVAEVRPQSRLLAQAIAPLALFFPRLWTEKGNRHRKAFLLSIVAFAVLAAVAAICR